MADTSTTTPKCGNCNKTDNLKRCAKCQSQSYCSRDCQKAHWKTHKKSCSSKSSGSTSFQPTPSASTSSRPTPSASSTPKALIADVDKPFHKLDSRIWLHDRPEQDVYKLLIDTFRLKLDDDYKFEGDVQDGTVYAGEPNSIPAFKKFLRLAERQNGLLPPWWSPEKKTACIAKGSGSDSGWCSLAAAPEKSDIIEHYGNPQMAMQMRMLGEQIYERGSMGQDGSAIRQMMMKAEGGSLVTSMIDASSMFRGA